MLTGGFWPAPLAIVAFAVTSSASGLEPPLISFGTNGGSLWTEVSINA